VRYLSVCSGIEAATVAWGPLGWQAVAFAEIEPFASAVLAHHYPHIPNLGDFTKITGDELGAVDLIVGGTPCQAFSVAGRREGLDDERGNLTLEYISLAGRLRPSWLVWENVPGVLSQDGGETFGTILRELAELGYGLAYRVLDAQYFGVPQRRRRVFVVGYFGDWRPAAAVLFEPDCLRGNSSPRRQTRQDVAGTIESSIAKSRGAGISPAAITATLKSRSAKSGSENSAEWAAGGFLQVVYVPEIVQQAMCSKWSKGSSGPAGDEHHNLVVAPLYFQDSAYGCKAYDTAAIRAGRIPEHCMVMTSTLQGARNAVAFCRAVSPAITSNYGKQVDNSDTALGPNVIAFHGSQDPDGSGEVTHPCGRNNGLETCIAIHPHVIGRKAEAGPQGKEYLADDSAYTMDSRGVPQSVAFAQNQHGEVRENAVCGTLNQNSNATGRNAPLVRQQQPSHSAVRRLTPKECERLQGFPDNYTLIPYKMPFAGIPRHILDRSYVRYLLRMQKQGKSPLPMDELIQCADGPRYRALGNSMAVPVMRWIGERIERYERGKLDR